MAELFAQTPTKAETRVLVSRRPLSWREPRVRRARRVASYFPLGGASPSNGRSVRARDADVLQFYNQATPASYQFTPLRQQVGRLDILKLCAWSFGVAFSLATWALLVSAIKHIF